jgi:arylsulfatase
MPFHSQEVLRVQPQRVPADAPNILIVLIDDAGPGLRLTYGDVRLDTLI